MIIHAEPNPELFPEEDTPPDLPSRADKSPNPQTNPEQYTRSCWKHLSQFSQETHEDFFQSIKQLDSEIAEVCTNVMDFSSSVPSIFDIETRKPSEYPADSLDQIDKHAQTSKKTKK